MGERSGAPSQWLADHPELAQQEPRGLGLLWRAGIAFLLPMAGALAGALLAGGSETRRFVGLAIGLVSGLVFSAALSVLLGRRKRAPAVGVEESQ